MPRKSHPMPTAITCDDDEIYRQIGIYLQIARKINKLTQAELASLVGVERTSITNIEKGQQRVPLHLLYKLCKVLEIEIRDMLPDVDKICQSY